MKIFYLFILFSCSASAADFIVLKRGSTNTRLVETLGQYSVLLTDLNKFVLTETGELRISLTGKPEPKHDDLGKGFRVKTAGYIRFYQTFNRVSKIELNNRSKAYCPKFSSLSLLADFLILEKKRDRSWSLTRTPTLSVSLSLLVLGLLRY